MEKEEKTFKEMIRQFFIAVLLGIFALCIMSLFASCGSRKVEKQRIKEENEKKEKIIVEHDITAYDNVTITSKSFAIDSTKEIITTKTYKPINPALPATFKDSKGNKHELNNTEYTESEIKRNKATSQETNTNTQHDSKTQDKSKETSQKEEKGTKDQKGKQIERKQFDPLAFIINWWWLWLLIVLILYLIKKYKEKIPFI
jgi:cbb3-type cytochrome oxidase subunit 3